MPCAFASIDDLLDIRGPNLDAILDIELRDTGVLDIKGVRQQVVPPGVHMPMGRDAGAARKSGESRESRLDFISRDMPRELLLHGLTQCAAATS